MSYSILYLALRAVDRTLLTKASKPTKFSKNVSETDDLDGLSRKNVNELILGSNFMRNVGIFRF